MQLVAYGAQDIYLTGQPNIGLTNFTFFTPNYNVLRIMSGMGGLALSDGPRRVEERIEKESTRDLSKFEYKFSPERETNVEKEEMSKYEYKLYTEDTEDTEDTENKC